MASLQYCCAAAYTPLRRVSAGISAVPPLNSSTFHLPPHSCLRSHNEVRVVVNPRCSPIFASNTNPSDKPKDIEASDTSPGPPVLTILAGLVVFSVICWIVGSLVMWLVGLVVH